MRDGGRPFPTTVVVVPKKKKEINENSSMVTVANTENWWSLGIQDFVKYIKWHNLTNEEEPQENI